MKLMYVYNAFCDLFGFKYKVCSINVSVNGGGGTEKNCVRLLSMEKNLL